jgi:hypothetical protein
MHIFLPILSKHNAGLFSWNIFHYMCYKNHHELLKHLLDKLPRDVVEALLAQQSKGRLNTVRQMISQTVQMFKKYHSHCIFALKWDSRKR